MMLARLRQLLHGARRDWCCAVAKAQFISRLDCGTFIVAGDGHGDGRVDFIGGFNAAHRADRLRTVACNAAGAAALSAAGISNVKLFMFSGVAYCSSCGANLRRHYGHGGGVLRDDEYVAELYRVTTSPTQ
jgi:hypothetical protein